jgi:hypothetical protein
VVPRERKETEEIQKAASWRCSHPWAPPPALCVGICVWVISTPRLRTYQQERQKLQLQGVQEPGPCVQWVVACWNKTSALLEGFHKPSSEHRVGMCRIHSKTPYAKNQESLTHKGQKTNSPQCWKAQKPPTTCQQTGNMKANKTNGGDIAMLGWPNMWI